MIDANTVFSPAQVQDMEQLLRIKEEIKVLEARKDSLSKSAKAAMIALGIDECDVNGSTFKLIQTERRTVTKSTKSEFIANLVGQGKQHLVVTSIEPDLDSVFAEVDAGNLSQNFVDKYVKVTSVMTLRTD